MEGFDLPELRQSDEESLQNYIGDQISDQNLALSHTVCAMPVLYL